MTRAGTPYPDRLSALLDSPGLGARSILAAGQREDGNHCFLSILLRQHFRKVQKAGLDFEKPPDGEFSGLDPFSYSLPKWPPSPLLAYLG